MLSKQNITDLQILVSRRNADLFEKRDQLNLRLAHMPMYCTPEFREMLMQEKSDVIDELDNNNKLATTLLLIMVDAEIMEKKRVPLKGSDLIKNMPLSY